MDFNDAWDDFPVVMKCYRYRSIYDIDDISGTEFFILKGSTTIYSICAINRYNYIYNFETNKNYYLRGHGRKLFEWIVLKSKNKHFGLTYLNEDAMLFWLKLGFRVSEGKLMEFTP